jgi:hypothetical protein
MKKNKFLNSVIDLLDIMTNELKEKEEILLYIKLNII